MKPAAVAKASAKAAPVAAKSGGAVAVKAAAAGAPKAVPSKAAAKVGGKAAPLATAGGGKTAPAPAGKPAAAPAALAATAAPAPPPPPPAPTAEELAAAAEAERRKNGVVVVRYNHYKKTLKLSGGELSASAVDEELALSFVFKRCRVHLGRPGADGKAPGAGAAALAARVAERAPPAPAASGGGGGGGGGEEGGEEAEGCLPAIFTGLLDGDELWVEVEEDAAEKASADARQAAYVAKKGALGAADDEDKKVKTEKVEGCRFVLPLSATNMALVPTATPRVHERSARCDRGHVNVLPPRPCGENCKKHEHGVVV
jgi:hypothetical protein